MRDLIVIGIWVVLVGGVFVWLWRTGQLERLNVYIKQTREELKKCTWPTWDELKGSTVVIAISILILGVFTVGVDFLFTLFVRWIT
jgi:preprotein translocase subunit SecE